MKREVGPTDYATWTEKIVVLGALVAVALIVIIVGWAILVMFWSAAQYIQASLP